MVYAQPHWLDHSTGSARLVGRRSSYSASYCTVLLCYGATLLRYYGTSTVLRVDDYDQDSYDHVKLETLIKKVYSEVETTGIFLFAQEGVLYNATEKFCQSCLEQLEQTWEHDMAVAS